MISGTIEKVSNTKILAANIGNNRQLTVYSNDIQLTGTQIPVAMILPYPKGKRPIQIVETNPLDSGFFKDIDACFPYSGNWGVKTFGMNPRSAKSAEYLPVLRSGSYQYSLANSTQDLMRINPDVFRIKPDLQSLLQAYENKHFAFVVCIIDSSASYSPFAYITDIVNSQVFVPTKHYHEHTNTFSDGFANNLLSNVYRSFGKTTGVADMEDWDHSIYLINTGQPGNAVSHFENNKRYSFAEYLNKTPVANLHRISMVGRHPNQDVVVSA